MEWGSIKCALRLVGMNYKLRLVSMVLCFSLIVFRYEGNNLDCVGILNLTRVGILVNQEKSKEVKDVCKDEVQ